MDFLISTRAAGARRGPGVVEALYALKSDIATLATPPPSPANQLEKVTIEGPHIMVTDEGFRKMYISPRKSEHTAKSTGDEDAKSDEEQLEGFIPGGTEEMAAFLLDDPELIILIPDGPCGTSRYRQMGTKCEGAKIASWEYASGKFGGNDAKGIKVMITSLQSSMLFYVDAIPEPA